MNKYYLLCGNSSLKDEAMALIQFTGQLILVQQINDILDSTKPYLLLDTKGLAICCKSFNPLYVDEIYNKINHRYKNLNQELLIQAVKTLDTKNKVTIIDLTAGLAKDATLLALYGYNVIMVEQNPLLASLIKYALSKGYLSNTAQIYCMNSLDFLKGFTSNTEINIAYLDPMFNHEKNAKAKKDMQIIQQLVANNKDDIANDALLFYMVQNIANKTVVKRDNKQACIVNNPTPSYVKQGKTVRYDVYINTRS